MRHLLLFAFVIGLAGCVQPPCRQDYQPCVRDQDCAGGTSCRELDWDYGTGARCERSCDTELDCPRDGGRAGRCLSVGDGRFSCFNECSRSGDCPRAWVCQPVRSRLDGSVFGVCLP